MIDIEWKKWHDIVTMAEKNAKKKIEQYKC